MSLSQVWQELRIRARPLYEPLSSGDENGTLRPGAIWRQFIPRGRRSLFAILGLIFVFVSGIALSRPASIDLKSLRLLRQSIGPSAGHFHILIPTGDGNSRFCRTSLSSALLGYPTPVAINWGGELCEEKFGEASWEWGKFHGILKYLQTLNDRQQEDLVLIVDGEDSWFQLKPEVLIKRYFDNTKQAEKRLRKKLRGMPKGVHKPEIIFAAQKRCHAEKKDNIGCYAAPEPPQFETTSSDSEYDPYLSDPRPRFLNSAMVLGSVSALHRLYQAGWDRWQNNPSAFTSRDDLFASFFGEQEFQREQLRDSTLSPLQRLRAYFFGSSTNPILSHAPPQTLMYAANFTTADYGLTLDYTSSLAHVPDKTGDWIRYSEPQTLYTAAAALNISSPYPFELAQDIAFSRPPLWSLAPYSSAYPFEFEDLPKSTPWTSVPLYTSLSTTVTPVLLTQRSSRESEETLSKKWASMWFSPHIRKKLQNIAYEPLMPVASTPLSSTSPISPRLLQLTQSLTSPRIPSLLSLSHRKMPQRPVGEKQWWAPIEISPVNKQREGLGFITNVLEHSEEGWKRWADVCDEGVQGEVIGDGKGKWVDLKVYPPWPELGHASY